MTVNTTGPSLDVLDFVVGTLDELTEDLDIGPIHPDLQLGALGLESISLVYLIAEVQQTFGLGDKLLRALRGEPPVDVRVMSIAEFANLTSAVASVIYQAGTKAVGR